MLNFSIPSTVKQWIEGILAAIINGFASGVILVVAAPATFNLQAGFSTLFWTSATLALLGVANFLKQHPLPSQEKP